MSNQVETRAGTCARHGEVAGVREIPDVGFPFVYYAIVRAIARRRPFRCPDCDQPLTV